MLGTVPLSYGTCCLQGTRSLWRRQNEEVRARANLVCARTHCSKLCSKEALQGSKSKDHTPTDALMRACIRLTCYKHALWRHQNEEVRERANVVCARTHCNKLCSKEDSCKEVTTRTTFETQALMRDGHGPFFCCVCPTLGTMPACMSQEEGAHLRRCKGGKGHGDIMVQGGDSIRGH